MFLLLQNDTFFPYHCSVPTIVTPPAPTWIDWTSGDLRGEGIEYSTKRLGDLAGVFMDEVSRRAMNPETEVYRVKFWRPVPDGTAGGLFWGTTLIHPGLVGEE